MSDEELPVYCICKSSDIDRFMIMCDECEEWFHGNCIKITEKEAKYIKYYFCKVCRLKNPLLKIKYRKNKKKEKEEFSASEKKKDKLKKLKKKKSEFGDIHKSSSTPQLSSESARKLGKHEKDESSKPEVTKKESGFLEKKGALKIYSSESEAEPEKVVSAMKTIEDESAASIHRNQSAADIIEEEMQKVEKEIIKEKVETPANDFSSTKLYSNKKEKKKESKRCGACENCLRKENCGLCDVCFDRERFGADTKSQKCRLRRCLNKKSSKKSKKKDKLRKVSPLPANKTTVETKAEPVKRSLNSFDDEQPPPKILQTTEFGGKTNYYRTNQCFGPGCTNAAIPPSKYCSDDCGRRLARHRLYQILPSRIQEWNSTPTIANEQGKVELERIRVRMEQARNELNALELKFRKLEAIIAAGKSLSIEEKRSDAEEDGESESDHGIYCVVCGHHCLIKNAIKHMDKCYIKIESQMSFGSVYPTRIEGSQRLFCDAFNEQQQTYCKRLQVLCPEHTKEPKVMEDEVCGCPFSCDIYGSKPPTKPSHFCRQAKRKCNKHFKWETMYRAEVDLQRIRQWLKIDEIFDEERRIRTAMASRAGVVSLLLHQTIIHDASCTDMRTKPAVSKKPAYRLLI